jgi:hypothetical protein
VRTSENEIKYVVVERFGIVSTTSIANIQNLESALEDLCVKEGGIEGVVTSSLNGMSWSFSPIHPFLLRY